MPQTPVVFYQESEGSSEVVDWLQDLRRSNFKAYVKCLARVERLTEKGHELQRPEAAPLQGGIYELRAKQGTVNYRLLYFFHGHTLAVIAWGLTKEAEVPAADINRTIKRKEEFLKNPKAHTYVSPRG